MGDRGEPSTSTPKPDIHGKKIMLCIQWDQAGMVQYELLQPGQTVNDERCKAQLLNFNRALKDKSPQYGQKHDKVILVQENARPRVAKQVKETWEALR